MIEREKNVDEMMRVRESIGERLGRVLDFYKLNMNSFSNRLGLKSNSVITRIVKDPSRGMSLDLLQKILFEFVDINADWLVTGRGEMFAKKEGMKPAEQTGPCAQCALKDERIRDLNAMIKMKDEVIDAKNALIANLEGAPPLGKQAASM